MQVKERCIVRFAMQDVNKGFESLVVFERDGQRHVLGLCESEWAREGARNRCRNACNFGDRAVWGFVVIRT